MLRQQLVAAIGKEVTVADFAAYMRRWDAAAFYSLLLRGINVRITIELHI